MKSKNYFWKKTFRFLLSVKRGHYFLIHTGDIYPFWPNTAGKHRLRFRESINSIKTLSDLTDFSRTEFTPIEKYKSKTLTNDQEKLGDLFQQYGSDKSTTHNYHYVYANLFTENEKVEKVLEIGLGTQDSTILSHMPKSYKSGASLRAFRDFFVNAQIFGCDIDEKIMFREPRITTFLLNQTEESSFESLGKCIGSDFDLMIDDGLHSINTNIRSLRFFLSRIKIGGCLVIEDIPARSAGIWKLIKNSLPTQYASELIQAKNSLLLVVRRLE